MLAPVSDLRWLQVREHPLYALIGPEVLDDGEQPLDCLGVGRADDLDPHVGVVAQPPYCVALDVGRIVCDESMSDEVFAIRNREVVGLPFANMLNRSNAIPENMAISNPCKRLIVVNLGKPPKFRLAHVPM